MSDNLPGIPVPPRIPLLTEQRYGLPTIAINENRRINPVLVIASAEKGAGRDHYTNILISLLRTTQYPLALIEIGLDPSLAVRAHRNDIDGNAPATERLRLDDQHWYPKLIDMLDSYVDRIVVVTVPAWAWRSFADKEENMLNHVRGYRGLGYAFVSPRPEAKVPVQHQNWLRSIDADDLLQAIVVRGLPMIDAPIWTVDTPGFLQLLAPDLLPQVRDAMMDTDQPATFHAAWRRATSGTHSAMIKSLTLASRQIADFVERARYSGMVQS